MSASDTMKSMGLTSPGAEREKLNKLLKIFDDKGINLEDSKVCQINRYILSKMLRNLTISKFNLHFTDVFMNLVYYCLRHPPPPHTCTSSCVERGHIILSVQTPPPPPLAPFQFPLRHREKMIHIYSSVYNVNLKIAWITSRLLSRCSISFV